MKIAAFLLASIAGPMIANAAPQEPQNFNFVMAKDMTCADLQARVKNEGALYIGSEKDLQRQERNELYFADPIRCGIKERGIIAYVRAADRYCPAGYICELSGD